MELNETNRLTTEATEVTSVAPVPADNETATVSCAPKTSKEDIINRLREIEEEIRKEQEHNALTPRKNNYGKAD